MTVRSCRFPVVPVLLAAALGAFAAVPAAAMHASGQVDPEALQKTAAGVSFSLGASVGVMEGTATERAIYYPLGKKFKLSELTWDFKDIVTAGLQGSVGLGRRFKLNLGFWSAMTEGDGMMVDRDWKYPAAVSAFLEPDGGNWTHESRHPDTNLDRGVVLDQNLSVLAVQAGAFSLRGLVGFKYDNWKWSARGGTYIYSRSNYNSRDATGTFPEGELVITYEQKFFIPYVGVGASWVRPSFQVETHLLASPLVSATDKDYHLLRGVLFEGSFFGGTYIGAGLSAVWTFSRHWSVTLGVEYQTIPEIVGDVTMSGDEGSGYFGQGGGIGMSAGVASLGAGFRF